IEYDLPDPPPSSDGSYNPRRGLHSVTLAPEGILYVTGEGASSILRMDPRETDFEKRFKEFVVRGEKTGNVCPDGITMSQGDVFFTEVCGNGMNAAISRFRPATAQFTRYTIPSPGTMHTPYPDSKGNVWYTMHFGSKLGMWDAKTEKVTDWTYP